MEDHTLRTVYRVVGEVLGLDAAELNEHSRFADLVETEDDFHDIYERCCDELGVPLAGILNTMPVYRQRVGDMTMNSWRNLAPFIESAARLLAAHDVRMESETLGSLAETMRKGVYVSSGEYWPTQNAPRSKRYVWSWFGGITAMALVLPYGWTLLPCHPVYSDCTLSTWAQMKEMLPFTLGLAFLVHLSAFLPGGIGMWRASTGRLKPPIRPGSNARGRR